MDNTFNIASVDKGVRLCSYKTSRFKTGRISFNIALPLEEHAAKNAILPYILNRSCEQFPNYIELNKKLASLYGATLTPSVSKAGESHVLRLSMSMIDNKFALSENEDIILSCFDLLLNLVFSPNAKNGEFDEKTLDREKALMLERIDGEMNDKRIYALRRLEENMFKNERFRVNAFGTKDEVEALTGKAVYDAWDNAIRTGRICVNIVGNTDIEKAKSMLLERLSKIDRQPIENLKDEIIEKAETVERIEETLPVKQGKLVMGFRAGMTSPEEFRKIKIMTDLFGGGTYSKLFMNVREKKSLCYYCSARFNRQKGAIIVQSGIENKNAETAIKEILLQLQAVADGEITTDDMNSSLLSMKDLYNSVCDTPEDIDIWCYSQITDDEFETPTEYLDALLKVTREDVIESAKKVTLDTIYLLKADKSEEEAAE